MVNITKSQAVPACLAVEKQKNGDYKCGDVLERTSKDFHNKCYLCEEKRSSSNNVEHFKPHKGDLDLKFDWWNLYWVCAHCNNVKLALYDNILDCTNPDHDVLGWMSYRRESSFPKAKVKIDVVKNGFNEKREDVLKTVELLNKIYNGHTPLKIIDSENMRKKLYDEIGDFRDLIDKYLFKDGLTDKEKTELRLDIKRAMSYESAFTAFKVWEILDNPALKEEFSDLLPANILKNTEGGISN